MKKIMFIILMIFSSQLWADSPLTSTEFYNNYTAEYPSVNDASTRDDKTLTDQDIKFLTDTSIPLDAKLAFINALGFQLENKGNAGKYLLSITPNATSYNEALDELVYKLSANENIIFAYLLAMDDYFDVKIPDQIADNAVKKDPDSLAIRLISGLIKAQIALDDDWCEVYRAVDKVRGISNLKQDIKPEAVTEIFEGYIDGYQKYCKEK